MIMESLGWMDVLSQGSVNNKHNKFLVKLVAAISESVACSACLLHVDQHLPDLATVLEDLEGAPVDSVDLLVLTIGNSGHSKWENSDWQLHACLLADA